MSAGSPIVPIRIPEHLLQRIEDAIASNNEHIKKEPWTRTSWIIDAIKAKLTHQSYGRREHKKRMKAT